MELKRLLKLDFQTWAEEQREATHSKIIKDFKITKEKMDQPHYHAFITAIMPSYLKHSDLQLKKIGQLFYNDLRDRFLESKVKKAKLLQYFEKLIVWSKYKALREDLKAQAQ